MLWFKLSPYPHCAILTTLFIPETSHFLMCLSAFFIKSFTWFAEELGKQEFLL